MTDEELARIEARAEDCTDLVGLATNALELVAEVRRLRRIESLARAVVDDGTRGYSVRLMEAALDGET
jgi:hypothetical protein